MFPFDGQVHNTRDEHHEPAEVLHAALAPVVSDTEIGQIPTECLRAPVCEVCRMTFQTLLLGRIKHNPSH